MRRRIWSLMAVAVVVLMAGGVVYQFADAGSDDSAAPASSTTSVVPTASSAPGLPVHAAPPPLVKTGEDFSAIIRSFIAYQDWVGAYPDPAALGETMAASCPCFAPSQKSFQELKDKGWRYEPGVATEVQQVRPREVTPGVVDVFVAIRYPERKILDATGRVVKTDPAEPPTSYFYTLTRGGDGRWRITQIELGTVL